MRLRAGKKKKKATKKREENERKQITTLHSVNVRGIFAKRRVLYFATKQCGKTVTVDVAVWGKKSKKGKRKKKSEKQKKPKKNGNQTQTQTEQTL